MTATSTDPATAPATAPDHPATAADGVRVVAVETFTDEEVALLSAGAPMVVAPHLETLDDAAREVALATAFRGLVARGVIDPPSDDALAAATGGAAAIDEQGRVSVDLGVRGDVMSVMTLRDAAEQVLAVARTTTEGQDFWYAHVVGDITLLEEVSPTGLHRFTLTRSGDLLALVGTAVVHPGATDGTGTTTVLAASAGDGPAAPPAALLERLGEAYLRADLVLLSRTDPDAATRARPELTGLFTGPAGSWSLVADPATGTLTASPESITGLRGRLARLVGLATPATASGAAS